MIHRARSDRACIIRNRRIRIIFGLHLLNKLLDTIISSLFLSDFLHDSLLVQDELSYIVSKSYAIYHDIFISCFKLIHFGHVETLALKFRELGLALGQLDLEIGQNSHQHVAQPDIRGENLLAVQTMHYRTSFSPCQIIASELRLVLFHGDAAEPTTQKLI